MEMGSGVRSIYALRIPGKAWTGGRPRSLWNTLRGTLTHTHTQRDNPTIETRSFGWFTLFG